MSSSLHQLSRFTPVSTNGQKVQTDLPGSKSNSAQSKTVTAISATSLSGSETDVSTSTENLSQEERYVIRHTARQEPQGQEKQEGNDGLSPHAPRQHSLDNASSYNTLIIHATGEDGLDPWASLSPSRLSSLRDSYISATSSHSKTTSFPSSSNSSSPTLSGTVPSATGSQQQGAASQQMREINDIPDDYLSQSHVLKHLAKEVKVVSSDCLLKDTEDDSNPPRRLLLLDLSPETHSRLLGHRYSTPIHSQASIARSAKLSLSRSQPDLSQLDGGRGGPQNRTRSKGKENMGGRAELVWPASDMIQLLIKENSSLKSELETCYRKVAKSQKLEQEVTNIHHSHQELMQSSDRREKLERAARQRLQEDNRVLRHQYELLLNQLESPHSSGSGNHGTSSDEALMLRREISKRDAMLAQLMAQNKELTGCRERQEIELAAQRATLQEQRTHIDILDTALTNAQANVMRLEEECRKRQLYEERVVQLQQSLSSLQLAREQLEGEINDLRISRRVNNAAAQTAPTPLSDLKSEGEGDKRSDNKELSDLRQRMRERDERLMSLESEVSRWQQWYLEENAMRQAVIDAASIPRDAKIAALEKTSQESERLMAEARSDKIRQLDELHAAQRRMADMESRSHELESRLAEKDAMIKVLQAAHHHHHSLLPSSGGSGNSPMLSRGSPHHHLHHGSTSSSYHRQPSPSSLGGAISNASMLSSLASGTGSGLAGELGASSASTTGVSTSASLTGYPRSFANMRTAGAGLGYQRTSSVVADYGTSPSSTVSSCSGSPLVSGTGNKTAPGSSSSRSFTEDNKSLDDQLQGLDSQLLSGRVLCCFSGFYNRGLATRKEGLSQPLLVGLKRRPPISSSMQQPSSSITNQQEDALSQIKYKRIQNSLQTQSQSSSDEGTIKLPSTPPPNSSKDSTKETSVLYMSGRYNAKSASPSSKQFLSRYSPNQSASLPPTPPPISKDSNSDLYYLRYGNKSSLPPTPPPSSKDSNPFFISGRYNSSNSQSQDKNNDIFYKYISSNQSSLPPTPPPPNNNDKDHLDRYLKSSSLYETSNNSKTNHEILLLEKQGRASQKQRRSSAGSQASSDDLNLNRGNCLPSAIPRPKPNNNMTGTIPRKPSRSSSKQSGGYNRLEESTSKESLASSNTNASNNVTSKLRLFQQSRKLTPSSSISDSSKTSSREKLSAGMKYRIQL